MFIGAESEATSGTQGSSLSMAAASKELRFVPSDPAHLDAMYQAMCQCQLLHPDPEDSVEEEGDDNDENDGFIFSVGENVARGNGGDHEEPMEQEGQFDDAD